MGCDDGGIWCMADPHFSDGDPALDTFLSLLKEFGESPASTLVLLGDLFDVWVALEDSQTPGQSAVIGDLTELSRGGKSIVYLVGNRDYFAEGLVPEPFAFAGTRWDCLLGGKKYRFEHGDLINSSDRRYLRWRAFSRSRAVAGFFKFLPAALRRRLARALAVKLAGTNREYRAYWPEREMREWARELSGRSYGAAVLGHFHVERELLYEGLKIITLPQFREDGKHLRITSTGEWAVRSVGGVRATPS